MTYNTSNKNYISINISVNYYVFQLASLQHDY